MPLIKSSSSSTNSTFSSASTSSSFRVFINHMLDSILHSFAPKYPQSSSQDLTTLQHDMNANLSLFEKTYVSFPELDDQDLNSNTRRQASLAY
ncbi:hypothetical protein [Absidia glauca]|uniref:Uncharacterized protein n=1 Tax=Absidia glauca TaxID=4829 RepID=A0A163LYS0_ABSGL|nr:hypothetical protein [Absidia glauca]